MMLNMGVEEISIAKVYSIAKFFQNHYLTDHQISIERLGFLVAKNFQKDVVEAKLLQLHGFILYLQDDRVIVDSGFKDYMIVALQKDSTAQTLMP